MHAPRSLRYALVAALVMAAPSYASRVIVPDNYASIQSAMDSGTDSVLVRGGTYDENLVMRRMVSVLSYLVWEPWHLRNPAPQVLGFSIDPASGGIGGMFQGLVFRGLVALPASGYEVHFEGCHFDSGVTSVNAWNESYATFSNCEFRRQCRVHLTTWIMWGCTIFGTGIDADYEGFVEITDNVVIGPAPFGISLHGTPGMATISGNTVIGTTDGIITSYPDAMYVTGNEVRNCSGTAFLNMAQSGGRSGTITYQGNRVTECGGRGFEVSDVWDAILIGNTVDSVGGDGIYFGSRAYAELKNNTIAHAGGNGILGAAGSLPIYLIGNRIVDTALDGIALEFAGTPFHTDSNVVGRAGGRGIVLKGIFTYYGWNGTVVANTVYGSGGSGIVLVTTVDSLGHNISCDNGGYGLTCGESAPRYLGCNDWFGNSAGATSGIAAGPSDLAVNPLFCDLPSDDVHLSAASPLASTPGCGLIGALGIGCAWAVSVDQPALAVGPSFSAYPSPSRDHVYFAIRGLNSSAQVEVFDLSGARRWRGAWHPGDAALEWSGRDAAGQPVAPGVYYARLTDDALVRHARVVIVR